MERLLFKNDLDSAHQLDHVMYSYDDRTRGSVLADDHTLTILLLMLEGHIAEITEYTYTFDADIRSDPDIIAVYNRLAPQTRWKMSEHTEIEGIRINALMQMRGNGEPTYDGDYISYQGGRVSAHCGNVSPRELLLYLAQHPDLHFFYIFAYPYWSEDHTAKYYRFEFNQRAHDAAEAFHRSVLETMRRFSQMGGPLIPKLPDDI